jgi:hypothetical protein
MGGWSTLSGREDQTGIPEGVPTVDILAAQIDGLEKHIEKYGSIVPQHASVWGQSRLMMHRNEFERVMRYDIYNFNPSIQATIAASDQAYLANSLSLQAGVGTLPAVDPSTLVSSPNDVITRNQLVKTAAISNYVTPTGKLALEPTLLEDQKKRYLDHLHELRRINEGDDNTDAPGYGLNLVRLPISVLTGACTQTGYGAECSFTALLHLPDDLLPQTFRELAANDITDLLTLPLTRFIENTTEEALAAELKAFEEREKDFKTHKKIYEVREEQFKKLEAESKQLMDMSPDPSTRTPEMKEKLENAGKRRDEAAKSRNDAEKSRDEADTRRLGPALYKKLADVISNNVPNSPRRINQSPIPPSQIVTVFGAHNLSYLTQHVRQPIKDHLGCKSAPYHLDVQAWLRNELGAAYQFLSQSQTECLWSYCGPPLAHAIRTQNRKEIIRIQEAFFEALEGLISHDKTPPEAAPGLRLRRSATSILAWTIIIDASLLNERFHEDMQSTHDAKGCPCAPSGDLPLFLPHPPPEVCQAFNSYVQCRWPLHIFALDPETEDQNIGDSFSLRREMQLAMSVAFTSGKIGARTFNQYVRRIEKDIDTIALNRTIIGFSHGDNTFGWRFYPRVQTPPIAGNLQTIFRDLLYGGYGPGYDLRRRRLENGIRECVALVIMPSFVPYMDLEVTGNWFRLADPKCKALTLKQTMRLSKTVKSIQDCATATGDEQCYRAGDVGLMLSKLEQLSQRLPLQQQLVNVPYENTHSGFEMLATGVTDLAPELVGWYGAPGINPNGDTALFLVGDNFSVHQTRVIVGGHWLDPSCTIACNTEGGTAADCTCSVAAAPAPAGTGTTAAPAATTPPATTLPAPMPSSQALPSSQGDQVALGAGPDSSVQPAGFFSNVTSHRDSSNVRPPLPTTTTNVLPPILAPVSNVTPKPALGTSTTTKSTNTTTSQGDGTGTGGGSPSSGSPKDSSTATGGGSPSGGSPKSSGSSASPSGDSTGTSTTQQTTNVTTSTTTPNPSSYVQVPFFQVELLSRQVMRVVIPKGVYSNNGFVDVHIATPYGVSQRLAIPIMCDTPKAAAPVYGYSVDANSKVTIKYMLLRKNALQGNPAYQTVFAGNGNKDAIFINWSSPTGDILTPANADFVFTFQGQDLDSIIAQNIAAVSPDDKGGNDGGAGGPKAKGGYFAIRKDDLDSLSRDLLNQLILRNVKEFGPDNIPPSSLTTKSIKIRLNSMVGQHVTESVPTSNQLTVQFEPVPPAAALDDGTGKNQNVILEYEKDGMGRLTFSKPQQFLMLRINLPWIKNDEGIKARIQLHGFNADSDFVEAEFKPSPGGNSCAPVDFQKLMVDLQEKINQKFRLGIIPEVIRSERITILLKGSAYKVPEFGAAGSLTIQPLKKN